MTKSDDDILKQLGLTDGFHSTKGKKVDGNVDVYSKIKTTTSIFNQMIHKRGSRQEPITVKLFK